MAHDTACLARNKTTLSSNILQAALFLNERLSPPCKRSAVEEAGGRRQAEQRRVSESAVKQRLAGKGAPGAPYLSDSKRISGGRYQSVITCPSRAQAISPPLPPAATAITTFALQSQI